MLTFDLPEEDEEFRQAQEGPEWKFLMMDILAHIRNELKHAQLPPEKAVAYEELRELIWHSIEDRKLKAD